MIAQVTKGIMQRYASLLVTMPSDDDNTIIGTNHLKTTKFLEIILHRAKSSHLQFKKVCCIVIKFLDCCSKETNYMKFLKFSLHKLFVAAFILSVPNVVGDDRDRITTRDETYHLYSQITGLPLEEVINCCSIVRPVLIRRSRQQRRQMLSRREQHSYFLRSSFMNSNSSVSPFSLPIGQLMIYMYIQGHTRFIVIPMGKATIGGLNMKKRIAWGLMPIHIDKLRLSQTHQMVCILDH